MLAEADAALAAVEIARSEPRGIVRLACPVALAQNALAPLVPVFLARFPLVRLQLLVSNRRVDVIGEGIDAAIRVRAVPSGEDGLVMRSFGEQSELLVASPEWLDAQGRPSHPRELAHLPTLSFAPETERQYWELTGREAERVQIDLQPRLICHDFAVLRAAALAQQGIALLPESVVRADLDARRLECVLPDWRLPQGILHVVFASRRGLLPAVRACIDFLAEQLPRALRLA
jgi:DNA-binding transcriptional LysR family regulator